MVCSNEGNSCRRIGTFIPWTVGYRRLINTANRRPSILGWSYSAGWVGGSSAVHANVSLVGAHSTPLVAVRQRSVMWGESTQSVNRLMLAKSVSR